MKIIKSYRNAYMKYTSDEFLIFYNSTYEVLKARIYKMWMIPAIMILSVLANKFLKFPSLFLFSAEYEWILLIVGIFATILVICDKWYGALLFAILCLGYLLGDIGWYSDEILCAIGAICSILSMLRLLQMKDLNTYFEMAKHAMYNSNQGDEKGY